MAENKKSFVFYADYLTTFEELSDEEAGMLMKHVLRYVNDQNPVTEDKLIKIAFEPIKQQLKRDLKSWEETRATQAEKGIIGNLKRWHPKLYEKFVKGKITLEEAVLQSNNRKPSHSDNSDRNTSGGDEKNTPATTGIAEIAVTDTVNDNVTDTVNDNEIIRANALAAEPADGKILKQEFSILVKELTGKEIPVVWDGLKSFITQKSPPFIEPYQHAWNLFAGKYGLAKVEVINDSRKRKFKSRIDERAFDFMKILEKIRSSNRLRGIDTNNDWKVTFDWIFENQSNYVKILEGNYQ